MTTLCDLPHDLVGAKILTKVPITSLKAIRSTCKLWESLSKDYIVGRSRHHEFLGFITMDYKVCSLRFDLQGVRNHQYEDGLLHSSTTKLVSFLDGVEMNEVLHYDSLVLCTTRDHLKLLVWNPYLGQTKWIETPPSKGNMYMYGLGYFDGNYKILRLGSRLCSVLGSHEIYDSSTDSWGIVDLNLDCKIDHYQSGVALKGHTYYFARGRRVDEIFVLCFDYTKERFRPRLPLPFILEDDQAVVLSCVRDDKLAVLYENRQSKVLEIWVTNKIESSEVVLSWSKFLKVDTRSIQFAHHTNIVLYRDFGSFFIDEEKKIVVVFINVGMMNPFNHRHTTRAYILGEEGYIKSLKVECPLNVKPSGPYFPFVSSSYLPSLLQLDQPTKNIEMA